MHTIQGANSIIAQKLSQALAAYTSDILQVSRHPRKVNPTDETFVADLLDAQATANAVAGSQVVYLVVSKWGLPSNLWMTPASWKRSISS